MRDQLWVKYFRRHWLSHILSKNFAHVQEFICRYVIYSKFNVSNGDSFSWRFSGITYSQLHANVPNIENLSRDFSEML